MVVRNTAPAFGLSFLLRLSVIFLGLNLALRLVLNLAFAEDLPISGSMLPSLLSGTINDIAALGYSLLLPATLVLLPGERFIKSLLGRIYCLIILFAFCALFIFTAFSEFFFWDEFNSRFNFIAVDYLVYTTELIQNMIESYPLTPLLVAVFLLAVLVSALVWRSLKVENRPRRTPGWKPRLAALGALYLFAALLFVAFSPVKPGQERPWNEYAKNGVYEIFSAYLNNQLDYRAFYPTMDSAEAFSLMLREIDSANGVFANFRERSAKSSEAALVRLMDSPGEERRPNVILVIMESMGLDRYGDNTPNLASLSAQGLSFNRMMSTGTRTVRGIEALMLGVPPTPGNSIVRRRDNNELFNLGTPFRERGYDQSFIYGGLGYFDNMNAFFAGNGYRVTDKLGFSSRNKSFSNAWGQCDEDLYSESLEQADISHAAGKAFMQVLLTTSNHRPFTFPEGKVDRVQGKRSSAINYADFAIGRFIEEARSRPWFEDTIFVFVGDHPSSIAGKTELPADAYGIVCIVYAPKYFQPETVDTLCSQVDLAPTLLAALNWDYPSQFFGKNAREMRLDEGRAWISTYQLLGFRTNDELVLLSPNGGAQVTFLANKEAEPQTSNSESKRKDSNITRRAIASYQCAYDLFNGKMLKEKAVLSAIPQNPSVQKVAGLSADEEAGAALISEQAVQDS